MREEEITHFQQYPVFAFELAPYVKELIQITSLCCSENWLQSTTPCVKALGDVSFLRTAVLVELMAPVGRVLCGCAHHTLSS